MLKRKLVKAGFFGHGAVFLMVSPFSTHFKQEPQLYLKQPFEVTTTTTVLSDTSDANAATGSVAPAIQLSSRTRNYIETYIRQNRELLEDAEKRSTRYFPIIERVFAQQELPLELKYLAVVESNLKPTACSKVGARGAWQLMSQTARDLGLKVNGHTDERTHFYKSTVAAAKHLKALYAQYGDWLLVIAAYNSGSGYVDKAIKKAGSKSFWAIQRFLPDETSAHVKHFIGTHYFFQEEGSLTVLTRKETREYLKKVAEAKIREVRSHEPDSIIVTR